MKGFHTHNEQDEKIAMSIKDVIFAGRDDNGNAFFGYTTEDKILSDREIQVNNLKHKENSDIAYELGISEKSVESYRKKIKSKGF